MQITTVELSDLDRKELEKGFHTGESHCFRMRCKIILLKSQGKSAKEISKFVDLTEPAIFNWLKRYKTLGIAGLKTRPGQGRKPTIDSTDKEAVYNAVKEERQRTSVAKDNWQNVSGKKVSMSTFRRFLRK